MVTRELNSWFRTKVVCNFHRIVESTIQRSNCRSVEAVPEFIYVVELNTIARAHEPVECAWLNAFDVFAVTMTLSL